MHASDVTTHPARLPAMPSAAQTVLLIGGTGFVGDSMRPTLRDGGHALRLLVRNGAQASDLEKAGYSTVVGDVTDPDSLARAMQDTDAVINLVAVIREHGQATFERLNYQGAVNVVDAARRSGVRRLLHMSALGAGDLPGYPYHYTKWRAENYVKDSGLDWTIFRPSIIFGPSTHYQFISALADVVRKAPLIPVVGDGNARFQPIHNDDVAGCFLAALSDPTTIGQTYEIAGPEVVTYEQMLDECARALGKHKRKVHVPVALLSPLMGALDALPFAQAPVTPTQLKMLKLDNTTPHNAAPALLNREPRPFRARSASSRIRRPPLVRLDGVE